MSVLADGHDGLRIEHSFVRRCVQICGRRVALDAFDLVTFFTGVSQAPEQG